MIRLPTVLLCLLFTTSIALIPPTPPTDAPLSTTLVDALSSDGDFTLLLRLIQRAKLVPTLNKLNGSTLFAPTNAAIQRRRDKDKKSIWEEAVREEEETILTDNVLQGLRQHLFYHLLNYTLESIPEDIVPQRTLHFPEAPVEPPTDEPPPSPPWLPVPGGLLGGEPQRLRTTIRDGKKFIGVDATGQGGARQVKETITVSNGVIYGVDRVLDLPGSLYDEITRHPSLSTIARILSDDVKKTLTSAPHLTLFLPADSAWIGMDPIERRYLESGFAQKDVEKIVDLHASADGSDGNGSVGWSQTWGTDAQTACEPCGTQNLRVSSTYSRLSFS